MDPFIGEIRALGFNWAPDGWLPCNGQTLNISQYQVLFAVIGTTYGGNGTTTFQLPNLNPTPIAGQPGLAMLGTGQSPGSPNTYGLGQVTGAANVTLTNNQLPAHGHSVNAITVLAPTLPVSAPSNTTYLSRLEKSDGSVVDNAYTTDTPANTTLNPSTVGLSGATQVQGHDNHQPYLAMNFCINWNGNYPQPAQ